MRFVLATVERVVEGWEVKWRDIEALDDTGEVVDGPQSSTGVAFLRDVSALGKART